MNLSRKELTAALEANKREQLALEDRLRRARDPEVRDRARERISNLRLEAEALLDS